MKRKWLCVQMCTYMCIYDVCKEVIAKYITGRKIRFGPDHISYAHSMYRCALYCATQVLDRRLSARIMSAHIARHDLQSCFRDVSCAYRSAHKRSPRHGRRRSAAHACRSIQCRPSWSRSSFARKATVCATAAEVRTGTQIVRS